MLLLQGFMDESESQEYWVLAGYFLPPEKWIFFIEDWKGILDQNPKINFHAKKHIKSTGKLRPRVKQLLKVIEKHEPLGLVTYIRKADWEEVLEPLAKPGFQHPYYALFQAAITVLFSESLCTGQDIQATFVFDKKGRSSGTQPKFTNFAEDILRYGQLSISCLERFPLRTIKTSFSYKQQTSWRGIKESA